MKGLLLFMACLSLWGREPDEKTSFAGQTSMNGIDWEAYKQFPEQWHLVTVRYRQDTSEMRFIYANEIAWTALLANKTSFPTGAIFGKVGAMTKSDPSFPSSFVPSGVRRFQLMVRDEEKYKDTDGWGYALFDEDGKTFPENPILTAKACAACHRLAMDRGLVFAQPLGILTSQSPTWLPRISFEKISIKNIPEEIRKLLPNSITSIHSLRGNLKRDLFQGTLDEVTPLLTQETMTSTLPSLLLSEDRRRFSLVFRSNKRCPGKGRIPFESYRTRANSDEPILHSYFCR